MTGTPKKKIVLYLPTAADVERADQIARNTLEAGGFYEWQKEFDERRRQPGVLQPDGMVYVGKYSPRDRDGNSLSKTFNVYAAPEDLPGTMTYVDAVKHLASLKNWHGYDGTDYPTDREIHAALRDGSYKGGWIIPTSDILCGKDLNKKLTMPDNLLAHKDKGAFRDTFKTVASSSGSVYPFWYWSSTENRAHSSGVYNVRFSDGFQDWLLKDSLRLSCRPVRLVPIKI